MGRWGDGESGSQESGMQGDGRWESVEMTKVMMKANSRLQNSQTPNSLLKSECLDPCDCKTAKYFCGSTANLLWAHPGQQM